MTVEIKSGSELDRAVAEAIGFVATHMVLGGLEAFVNPREGSGAKPMIFMPSVDLNDAFSAAEVVGLFKIGDHVLRQEVSDESWEVASLYHSHEVIVSSEATPALAICGAILALAK